MVLLVSFVCLFWFFDSFVLVVIWFLGCGVVSCLVFVYYWIFCVLRRLGVLVGCVVAWWFLFGVCVCVFDGWLCFAYFVVLFWGWC